jgi:plastocyanin
MRRMAIAAACTALVLAGCGSSNKSNKSSSSSGGGGGATLKIAADPGGALKFTSSSLTTKAGTVTVQFANQSSTPHAVKIEGNGIEKGSDTITSSNTSFTVTLKPGKYTFYCPVDGHRAAGMQGTLTVS